VQWASLVNLVAGREVVPEFLQEDLSAERLVERWDRCSTRPARRRWPSARGWRWCASDWARRVPPIVVADIATALLAA
jgi:hypothetical protein